MKYSFFANLLIFIILTGCQSVKPRNLSPATEPASSGSSADAVSCLLPTDRRPLPAFFSSSVFDKALYKAVLDIREHHITGLVFIKNIQDSGSRIPDSINSYDSSDSFHHAAYRIVFSNEFGMTYFDIQVNEDNFLLNYCFEPLNKKTLWKILGTDFRLLFASEVVSAPEKRYIQNDSGYLVSRNNQGNLKRWDLYTPSGDTLVAVHGKSNMFDQTMISFTGYQNIVPARVVIVNPIVNLKFSLSLLSVN